MKFLIDNNLSPKLSVLISTIGFESLHVKDIGKQNSTDQEIFEFAFENNFIIITADTDFGYLLSRWNKNLPSVILFRFFTYNPQTQLSAIKVITENHSAELINGSLILIEPEKIRIRTLPLHK